MPCKVKGRCNRALLLCAACCLNGNSISLCSLLHTGQWHFPCQCPVNLQCNGKITNCPANALDHGFCFIVQGICLKSPIGHKHFKCTSIIRRVHIYRCKGKALPPCCYKHMGICKNHALWNIIHFKVIKDYKGKESWINIFDNQSNYSILIHHCQIFKGYVKALHLPDPALDCRSNTALHVEPVHSPWILPGKFICILNRHCSLANPPLPAHRRTLGHYNTPA